MTRTIEEIMTDLSRIRQGLTTAEEMGPYVSRGVIGFMAEIYASRTSFDPRGPTVKNPELNAALARAILPLLPELLKTAVVDLTERERLYARELVVTAAEVAKL